MSGKTKKFFALKNFKIRKSKRKPDNESYDSSGDIVAEAERIIDTYLYRIGYDKKGGKRHKPWFLEFVLPSAIIAAGVYFAVHFIK